MAKHFKHVVSVPTIDNMDNETFLLHIENRHAKECKVEGYIQRHVVDAWVGVYRAYHERLHRIARPGQHDHVHEDDEEDVG